MSENARATLNALEDIYGCVLVQRQGQDWWACCYDGGQLVVRMALV